jgi:hypothetical protein
MTGRASVTVSLETPLWAGYRGVMRQLSDQEIRRVSDNRKAWIVARAVFGVLLVCGMVASNLIWGDPESPLMVVLSAAAVVLLLGVVIWLTLRRPS